MPTHNQLIYISGLLLTLASSIAFLFALRRNAKVSPTAKHIFSTCLGIGISLWVYGRRETILILSPTFLIWMLKGLAVQNSPNFVKLSSAALLAWLAYWHLQDAAGRGGQQEYKVSFTTSLMLVVSRLIMVLGDLSAKRISLLQCSFWRFFGYSVGFGTFLAGPLMPISTYLAVVEHSTSVIPAAVSNAQILTNALWLIGQSLVFGVLHCVIGLFWKPSKLVSAEFALASCWTKALWIWGAAFSRRLQYYFAWRFAEGCSTLVGFTQEQNASTTQQPNVRIIKVLACELASSPKEFLDNWHISTARWLYDYVYIASVPAGEKPGVYSTLLTHFVSAFWHGTNFGYYVTFGSAALNILAMRQARRKTWHWIVKLPVAFRKVFGVLMTQFFVSGFMAPFLLLGVKEVMHFEREIWWLPQVVTLVVFVAGVFL